MGLFERIPARIWLTAFVIGAGAAVAIVANDRLTTMQSLMHETSAASDGAAEARYVPSSDMHPNLSKAVSLSQRMQALDGEAQQAVDAIVSSVADAVAKSDQAAAVRGLTMLEGYADFYALACQVRGQFQGGTIKSMRLADGTHRLPFECRDPEGRMFYPRVTALMPIVDDAGLVAAAGAGNGVLGSKRAGTLEVSWAFPVLGR